MSHPSAFSTEADLTSRRFIDHVLGLRPRIAVFDCDGTLWTKNSGEEFFYWSMDQGMVSPEVEAWARARYDDYLRGSVEEDVMCGEMTTMYAGLSVRELEDRAREFFEAFIAPTVFPEMLQLTRRLAQSGCDLWAVSSTNEWVVREGIRDFGIPPQQVLAATAECVDGVIREKLARMPTGPGKAVAIREAIAQPVDAIFGNSIHDADMLKLARHAFAVNPNPDLEHMAIERSWTIYWPEAVRRARE